MEEILLEVSSWVLVWELQEHVQELCLYNLELVFKLLFTLLLVVLLVLLSLLSLTVGQPNTVCQSHHLFSHLGTFGQKGAHTSVNDALGISGTTFSVAASAAIIAFVAFLEKTFPWALDLAPVLATPIANLSPVLAWSLTSQAWSPIAAGIVVGMLQVPSFVSVGTLLGTSSSFVAVIANVVKNTSPSLLENLPYLKKFFSSHDYWQMGVAAGLVAAGYLSSMLGNSTAIVTSTVSPASAFFGGVLLLLGARTAGGCTSGHGLSGMATLSVASFMTVASMFGGAIAVSNMLYG